MGAALQPPGVNPTGPRANNSAGRDVPPCRPYVVRRLWLDDKRALLGAAHREQERVQCLPRPEIRLAGTALPSDADQRWRDRADERVAGAGQDEDRRSDE